MLHAEDFHLFSLAFSFSLPVEFWVAHQSHSISLFPLSSFQVIRSPLGTLAEVYRTQSIEFIEAVKKMGDHLALLVNRLLTESTLHAAIESRNRAKQVNGDEEVAFMPPKVDAGSVSSKLVECRICQDEDWDSNMETPCSCSGSLKYAHRRCVQRWCNEKGNTICEICHKPFQPGYQAPPPLLVYGQIPVNFRRTWQISRRELADAQFVETISSDETILNSSFVEPSSRSLIFRSIVAVIFVGLLILRHMLPIMVGGGSEFIIPVFLLAALRIAGILLLVYVTMIAVTGLRRHRYQEENSIASASFDEEPEQPNLRQHSHVIQIS